MRAKTIGVKQGSAVDAASYRSGETLRNEKADKVVSYSRKQGILYTNLMTPEHFPYWAKKRGELWNGVEKREHQKNARYAKELVVALPHELTLEQQIDLLENYIQEQIIPLGIACDIAIHTPETNRRKWERDEEGNIFEDQRNIHAHILMTDRPMTEQGEWAKNKNRSLNAPKVLENFKKQWAIAVNAKLGACGFSNVISFESYAKQGSKKIAQIHEGKLISGLRKRAKKGKISDYIDDPKAAKHYQEVIDENDLRREHNRKLDEAAEEDSQNNIDAYSAKVKDIEATYNAVSNWAEYTKTFSHNQPAEEQDNEQDTTVKTNDANASQLEFNAIDLLAGVTAKQEQETAEPLQPERDDTPYQWETWEDYINSPDLDPPDPQLSPQYQPPNNSLDRVKQPLKTSNSWVAANSTEMEALELAFREQNQQRNINNRRPKTAVTEYRLKLAEITAKFKPEKVAQNFAKGSQSAMDFERLIRDYLKRKGYNSQQILRAMRTASPALYKRSKAHADRYARRFNNYLRKTKRQYEQQQKRKLQLVTDQLHKKKQGKGRGM